MHPQHGMLSPVHIFCSLDLAWMACAYHYVQDMSLTASYRSTNVVCCPDGRSYNHPSIFSWHLFQSVSSADSANPPGPLNLYSYCHKAIKYCMIGSWERQNLADTSVWLLSDGASWIRSWPWCTGIIVLTGESWRQGNTCIFVVCCGQAWVGKIHLEFWSGMGLTCSKRSQRGSPFSRGCCVFCRSLLNKGHSLRQRTSIVASYLSLITDLWSGLPTSSSVSRDKYLRLAQWWDVLLPGNILRKLSICCYSPVFSSSDLHMCVRFGHLMSTLRVVQGLSPQI